LDGDREVGKLTKMLPRISRDLRMYALPGDEPQHFQISCNESKSNIRAESCRIPLWSTSAPQYHEAKMP
jgi:hypothetical protein